MGFVIQPLAMVMLLQEADLGSVCMEEKEANGHADQCTLYGVKGNQSIVVQGHSVCACVCVCGARSCICIWLRGKMEDVNVWIEIDTFHIAHK